MHTRFVLATIATTLLTTAAMAQSIFAPNGYAAVSGNSNNAFPWNRANAAMRHQNIYSGTNFTLQSVSFPLLINRLRFRTSTYAASTTWGGGSWPNVQINLSTAATTYLTASATFASNHGPDLTNVLTGPVTVLPGAGNGVGLPGPIYIDIPLATPFLYNPTSGDLCVEVILDGIGWSGTSTQCEAISGTGAGGPALGTRIYNTTSHTAATGTVGLNYTLGCEFSYVPASGYAYSTTYGTGCYDLARSSFYQLFPNATFSLSNNAVQMLPTGTGYVVTPSSASWWTPVGTNLGLTDDSVSAALALPFTFNYPGGNTTSLYASSNGFVWMQANTNNGCCAGVPGDLLGMGARVAPLWSDLNPGAGGSVVFDVDPINQVGHITWSSVPEFGGTNTNTFQVSFFASGIIEMRWQTCSSQTHVALTGWSPGGGARDPGSINILTSMPIITGPDVRSLELAVSARPVIGTTFNLVTSNIVAGTPVGANILSFTQHNPGLDLGVIGMPNCRQYVGLDSTRIFVVGGSSNSMPFIIPNNSLLAGLRFFGQSAVFTSGFNPLGVFASNAVGLVLDLL